jgi:DNA-binding LacI/PurR family transcriptional regulator
MIWSGVVAGAQEHDVNLIGIAGDNIVKEEVRQANILYDLVTPETCTGIVTWSLGAGSDQELEALHSRFQPLPIVTVNRVVSGHPAVMTDDYPGIQETVAHLIETHGCRRLAFIRALRITPSPRNGIVVTGRRWHSMTSRLIRHW